MKKLTKLLCAALVWVLLLGAAVSCAKQPDSPVQDPPKQEDPSLRLRQPPDCGSRWTVNRPGPPPYNGSLPNRDRPCSATPTSTMYSSW